MPKRTFCRVCGNVMWNTQRTTCKVCSHESDDIDVDAIVSAIGPRGKPYVIAAIIFGGLILVGIYAYGLLK